MIKNDSLLTSQDLFQVLSMLLKEVWKIGPMQLDGKIKLIKMKLMLENIKMKNFNILSLINVFLKLLEEKISNLIPLKINNIPEQVLF